MTIFCPKKLGFRPSMFTALFLGQVVLIAT